METERVKISQLQVNEQNPRTCTDKQFEKLVRSVITFPKMLEVRPIVVGEGGVALGGNMRLRALQAITTMTDEEIMRHIEQSAKFNGRTEVERVALLRYWQKWQHDPMVSVARTDNMTEDERREFIIKDNVGFGAWDWDMLANDWETDELDDWGLSAWKEKGKYEVQGGEENYSPDDFGDDFTLADGDKEPIQHVSFILANEQADFLRNAIKDVKASEEFKYVETFGNENGNGNAIYLILRQWTEQRK